MADEKVKFNYTYLEFNETVGYIFNATHIKQVQSALRKHKYIHSIEQRNTFKDELVKSEVIKVPYVEGIICGLEIERSNSNSIPLLKIIFKKEDEKTYLSMRLDKYYAMSLIRKLCLVNPDEPCILSMYLKKNVGVKSDLSQNKERIHEVSTQTLTNLSAIKNAVKLNLIEQGKTKKVIKSELEIIEFNYHLEILKDKLFPLFNRNID